MFAAPSLGMRVLTEGCVPLSEHTDVISSFPRPSEKKGLQHFLGIISFYIPFIQGAAGILITLTEVLKGKV